MTMARRGIRKATFSKSGLLLHESNDTPAKRIWDALERTVLPVRARDVVMNRFPFKQTWDGLSLAQMLLRRDFDLAQKRACLKFYFDAGGVNNLYATLTRSGSRWTSLTFDLALDLKRGGDGNYVLDSEAWRPNGGVHYSKFDWRTPAGITTSGKTGWRITPLYYHTHLPHYRTRCQRVRKMNVVVVVRSVLEVLESLYYKLAHSPHWPEITVDDEDSFPWERNLDDLIEFHNSWGDVAMRHGSCRVFRYHELKADPVSTHKEIADFWGLDLPEDLIAEALNRTSKKAMKEKLSGQQQDETIRVSYRKERGSLSEERVAAILERLRRELIHDFGYDYSDNHQWGHYYE